MATNITSRSSPTGHREGPFISFVVSRLYHIIVLCYKLIHNFFVYFRSMTQQMTL